MMARAKEAGRVGDEGGGSPKEQDRAANHARAAGASESAEPSKPWARD